MPFVDPGAGADPRDLCLLADVKALMQKTGPNAGTQDDLIQSLITRTSVKIMGDTRREFVPGGPNSEAYTAATRTFEYVWSDTDDETFVDLSPYDLQLTPVPTILIDTDTDTPTTLDTDHYRLWPQPALHDVFMAVRIRDIGTSLATRWRTRQIQVTGNWGFPSIPYDVTQACAETVIHWISNYPGARRPEQIDAATMGAQPRSYPMTALDLLGRFTRVAI